MQHPIDKARKLGGGELGLDFLCFSHLRWNFVYQRPQHLLSRFARRARVHLWEEPVFGDRDGAKLERSTTGEGVHILTPLLPSGLDEREIVHLQRSLLNQYAAEQDLVEYVAWYYTPMA